MPRLIVSLSAGPNELISAANRLRLLAVMIDQNPEQFRPGADAVTIPVGKIGETRVDARVIRDYHKGQRLELTRAQTDDDDGTERVTPAGSIVEIVDVIAENSVSPYAVACPKTGGSWFFSADELDEEATVVSSMIEHAARNALEILRDAV